MEPQPIMLKPERRAELEEYAQLHGQTPADALDDLLGARLEWEKREQEETIKAAMRGYEDMKAGRTKPAAEVYEPLRVKHGL